MVRRERRSSSSVGLVHFAKKSEECLLANDEQTSPTFTGCVTIGGVV